MAVLWVMIVSKRDIAMGYLNTKLSFEKFVFFFQENNQFVSGFHQFYGSVDL